MQMATVDDVLRKLPPELQQEVRDFAEFLLHRQTRKTE
jgi:hypothetical protein